MTSPSRREVRWLEFMNQIEINELMLIKGKVHVLDDALSRAPHTVKSKANATTTVLQTLSIDSLDKMTDN